MPGIGLGPAKAILLLQMICVQRANPPGHIASAAEHKPAKEKDIEVNKISYKDICDAVLIEIISSKK